MTNHRFDPNTQGTPASGRWALEREAMAPPRTRSIAYGGGERATVNWPPRLFDAAPAGAPAHPRRFNTLRDVVETAVLTLVIAAGVQVAVQSRQIEGSSMEPTLHNGQRLLVNRLSYLPQSEPQRGDIVVFRAWDQDEDYIKRVIGVPGDEIEIRDNRVRVNGSLLDEPYIHNEPTYGAGETVVLAPGDYYVLGDNRGNSSDSRLHGPLPRDRIIGKAWLTYWPLGELGFVSDSKSYAAPGRAK